MPTIFSFIDVVDNISFLTQTISLTPGAWRLSVSYEQHGKPTFSIKLSPCEVCDTILIFTSVLWVKCEKKRPTTTRTRECVNINTVLQDTTKRTWLKKELVRVAHERMLEVLDNDSARRIFTHETHRLRAISGTAAPPLPNTSTGTARGQKASLVQPCCKTSQWIENLLIPTPTRTRCRWTGDQLKLRAYTIKAGHKSFFGPRIFGCARWRKDWVKVSSNLGQDRRAWSALARDVVNAIGDAGSTRPGWLPTQVQGSRSKLWSCQLKCLFSTV